MARGSRNWEVVSKGAVFLMRMVGDQQEEAVRIVVGSGDEQLGDIFVKDAGRGNVDLDDFDFEKTG